MMIYGILTIIGTILLGIALYLLQKRLNLLKTGVIAEGRIREFLRVYNEKGRDRYYPIIEYQDQDQAYKTMRSRIAMGKKRGDKGQFVRVVYDPRSEKNRFLVSYLNLFLTPIILACLAAPFLVIGIGYYLYQW